MIGTGLCGGVGSVTTAPLQPPASPTEGCAVLCSYARKPEGGREVVHAHCPHTPGCGAMYPCSLMGYNVIYDHSELTLSDIK